MTGAGLDVKEAGRSGTLGSADDEATVADDGVDEEGIDEI